MTELNACLTSLWVIPNWEERYYTPEVIATMQKGLHKLEDRANMNCINAMSCTRENKPKQQYKLGGF